MIKYKGIPAAPGYGMGKSFFWHDEKVDIPQYEVSDVDGEVRRLARAIAVAIEQLDEIVRSTKQETSEEQAEIFEAQKMFLSDQALVKLAKGNIKGKKWNAEFAWHEATEFYARQIESLPDETLSERAKDVRDIGMRVVRNLLGKAPKKGFNFTDPVVLLADDLTPSQTVSFDKSKILGFCTAEGGATSHAAILAKALGIPAVVGLGKEIKKIPDGTLTLVDGFQGFVVVNPDGETAEQFKSKMGTHIKEVDEAIKKAAEPAKTKDGSIIEVSANVGSVDEAAEIHRYGADGIGLLRTEFIFLNRKKFLDEEAQYLAYKKIFENANHLPVVFRTLDVGGDKEVAFYDFGFERNPFLGYRAIRIFLDHPDDFKMILRALLRAGYQHDLRIMFPMVATLDELLQAKEILQEVEQALVKQNVPYAERYQLGIMVEIPSVPLMADAFAEHVDFFSVGTNDLTQYTFAAERGNKRLAYLSDPCHPAILKQIKMVADAAKGKNIWVGVCGEMAGDLQAIPVLIGLGVGELSMSPQLIPLAKQEIRNWKMKDAEELAKDALIQTSAADVRMLVEKRRAAITP